MASLLLILGLFKDAFSSLFHVVYRITMGLIVNILKSYESALKRP
jgi:hypothetical protein